MQRIELQKVKDGSHPKPDEGKQYRIYSAEHRAWWRPKGAGYTPNIYDSGIYTGQEAWEYTSHCGPEKKIVFHEVDDHDALRKVEADAELLRSRMTTAGLLNSARLMEPVLREVGLEIATKLRQPLSEPRGRYANVRNPRSGEVKTVDREAGGFVAEEEV